MTTKHSNSRKCPDFETARRAIFHIDIIVNILKDHQ